MKATIDAIFGIACMVGAAFLLGNYIGWGQFWTLGHGG